VTPIDRCAEPSADLSSGTEIVRNFSTTSRPARRPSSAGSDTAVAERSPHPPDTVSQSSHQDAEGEVARHPGRSLRARRGVAAGRGRPPGFDAERYKQRIVVERAINKLKGYRATATRYDKPRSSSAQARFGWRELRS
jgi:hypothetical protein